MIKLSKSCVRQSGFTIIELMIATTIVSVILLLSTIMITNIGNLYYKGISQSRTQDDVRAIADEISQRLELTDKAPVPGGVVGPHGEHSYCIGSTTYTYVLGKQIASVYTDPAHQLHHVLWRDSSNTACPPQADLSLSTPTATGTELISPRSRLTAFSISSGASPYTLTVNIAFGDIDQLCNSNHNDCNTTVQSQWVWSPNTPAATDKILCKGSKAVKGQQFCGTANLMTTVVNRLQ